MYCYSDDILRCYESAEKGLETWGNKSMKSRIQILSKFEPILKLSGYVIKKFLFLYNILLIFVCP